MQRTTTGIRLLAWIFAAIGGTAGLSVAQPGDDEAQETPATQTVPAPPVEVPEPLSYFDPDAETLEISLPGGSTIALLKEPRRGSATGTVILLPGNERPYPGTATDQLYNMLPEHDWQVVVLALAPLPAARYGQFFPARAAAVAAEVNGEESDETSDEAQDESAPAPDVLQPQPKSGPPKTYAEWEQDGTDRIAALLNVLQGRGVRQLWLVGEGYGAQLAARFLADNTPSNLAGVSYIDPRVPPGREASWPNDPALPALDILDPRLGDHVARQRSRLAAVGLTENYVQLRLAKSASARFRSDTLLSRRLRGWMLRQTGTAG